MTTVSRDIQLEPIHYGVERAEPADTLNEVDGPSLNHREYQESAVVQAAERPTKQYQILLLLSGFFMAFHVNGINSVYGIFQVVTHKHPIAPKGGSTLYSCFFSVRNFIHQRRQM